MKIRTSISAQQLFVVPVSKKYFDFCKKLTAVLLAFLFCITSFSPIFAESPTTGDNTAVTVLEPIVLESPISDMTVKPEAGSADGLAISGIDNSSVMPPSEIIQPENQNSTVTENKSKENTVAISEDSNSTDIKSVKEKNKGISDELVTTQSDAVVTPTTPPQNVSITSARSVTPEIDTNNGVLAYSYPITMPPGRNGMQPSLVLNYSSQDLQEGGVLGSNWSLNIPYISRLSEMGVDKLYSSTTPQFFISSIDGELATTTATSSYVSRVENGSFNTYNFSNNQWSVQDKEGNTYKFGYQVSTRQDDVNNASQVYKWMLEEVRDTNDNYIKYTYFKDSGQIYPASIVYTGHGSSDGIFEVDFLRENRSDIATSSKAGFITVSKYRVNEIDVKVNGSVVRQYVLSYTTGDNDSRSLLSSIAESGIDSQSNVTSLPTINFTYQTQTPGWASSSVWNLPIALAVNMRDQGFKIVDVNGDGLPDILNSVNYSGLAEPNYTSLINTGNGWVASSTWNLPVVLMDGGYEYGYRILDINGDNRADIVYSALVDGDNNVHYATYINNGHGWASDPAWNLPVVLMTNLNDRGYKIVDINGDGLPDIMQAALYDGDNNVHYASYINNGHGWTSDPAWNLPVVSEVNSTEQGMQFVDVNGDGLTDIVNSALWDGDNNVHYASYINNGHGWTSDPTWNLPVVLNYNTNDRGYRFVDVNGDNLPDIVYSAYYDGDPNPHYQTYINNGHGWNTSTEWNLPAVINTNMTPNGYKFVDVDGDSLPDILYSEYHDGDPVLHQNNFTNHGKISSLIAKIDNPAGGSTSVTYKPAAQYTDASGSITNLIPYPIHTVTQLSTNDGATSNTLASFRYDNGKFYYSGPFEKRFAGFGKIESTDGVGNVTKTYFHQGDDSNSTQGEYQDDYYKTGKPYRDEVYDNLGYLYSKTIKKWDSVVSGNSGFVKLSQIIDSDYDGLTTHKDKAESYLYDDSTGNQTQKIQWGEVTGANDGTFTDSGTDKYISDYTYAASASSTVKSAVSNVVISDQNSSKVKEIKYYYDSLPFGSVDKGNPTKQEDWKSGTEYINRQKVYNSYGLVTQSIDPRGKQITYGYDAYYQYPTTVTNPLSQVTQHQYDYASGKVTQTIDPNDVVFQTTYDGLGRILQEKQPDVNSSSTLVTKVLYAYTDTANNVSVKQSNYLNATSTVDAYAYFDGLGRKIQERAEAEGDKYTVINYSYDERGLLKKETLPYVWSGYNKMSDTGYSYLDTIYTYDPLQRVVSTTNVIGTVTNSYNNWKTTITDLKGVAKDIYKDAYGNLVRVDEHNGSSVYSTVYVYDGLGNLTGITDALGNVRHFSYDGLGRRLAAEDLHAPTDSTYGSWSYVYDNASNLTQKTDPKGQVINYTYDDINRPLTEDFAGQAGTEVSYEYDTCTYGVGRVCSISKDGVNETKLYDPLGRISNETKTVDSTDYQTTYLYDRQGNAVLLTNPDGSQIKYIYNNAGQIGQIQRKEAVDVDFSDVVINFDYSPTGKIAVQEYANGVIVVNHYDATKLYRLVHKTTVVPDEQRMGQSLQYSQQILNSATADNQQESLPGKEIAAPVTKLLTKPRNKKILTPETGALPPPVTITTESDILQNSVPIHPVTTPISYIGKSERNSLAHVYRAVVSGMSEAVSFVAKQFSPQTALAAATELYDTPLFDDSNLVSYYRFSSNSVDSKGQNSQWTEVNVSHQGGRFGNGIYFWGSNSYDQSSTPVTPIGAKSISFWVNTSQTTAWLYQNPTNGFNIIFSSNTLYFQFFTNGNYQFGAGIGGVNDGQWHHIVLTWDGTTAANKVIIYKDGSQAATTTANATETNTPGNLKLSPQNSFQGTLDDLAIFSRSLTATEVSHLYYGDWPPATPTVTNATTTPQQIIGNRYFDATVTGTGFEPLNLQIWFFNSSNCSNGCRVPNLSSVSKTQASFAYGLTAGQYTMKLRNTNNGSWSNESSVAVDANTFVPYELYDSPLFNDSNLISYWRMEGDSTDSKGNNNGTDYYERYGSTYGKFNKGTNPYYPDSRITIGDPANLRISGNMTVNYWLKVINDGSGVVISRGNSWGFSKDGGGHYVTFNASNGSGVYASVSASDAAITDGSWHMITGVFVPNSRTSLYVDGVLAGSDTTHLISTLSTNNIIVLGCYVLPGYSCSSNWAFTGGAVDDLSIFNRSLTDAEIASLYTGVWAAPTAAPSIGTVVTSPQQPLGNQTFTATVSGTNFDPAALQAWFFGGDCGTSGCQVQNYTRITYNQATFQYSLATGQYTLKLRNSNSGTWSNTANFVVNELVPAISSITTSPQQPLNNQSFIATVVSSGNNFDPANANVWVFGDYHCISGCQISNLISVTASQIMFSYSLPADRYFIKIRNMASGTWSNGVVQYVDPVPQSTAPELSQTPLASDSNLPAYWRFEGNPNSYVGNFHGSDSGATYNTRYGIFNQGVSYNGTAYTSVGPALANQTQMSLSFWLDVRDVPTTTAEQYGLFGNPGFNTAGQLDAAIVNYGNFGKYRLRFHPYSTQGSNNADSPTDLNTHTWYHVVITYDTTTKRVQFYVNGNLDSQGTLTKTVAPIDSTGFYIGRDWQRGFNGHMDDFAVFNRILTPTEVYNIYNGNWQDPLPVVDGTAIQDLSYTYDNNGNIAQTTDNSETLASKVVTYSYDDLNRLTQASTTNVTYGGDYVYSYTYDALGSILSRTENSTTTTYIYATSTSGYYNPDAAIHIGNATSTYDNNGNLLNVAIGTSTPASSYTWDYNNRMTQSVVGTATSTYAYDHNGQRVKQTVGGTTTVYPSKYYNTDGTTPTKHIFLPDGTMIATIVGAGTSTTVSYIHTDHLGGMNVATDDSRVVAELMDYYPYGGQRLKEQSGSFDERKKFAGYERDDSTGLDYVNARYYEGARGQFISQDPAARDNPQKFLSDPQQLNYYSYARNNPVNITDPSGQCIWDGCVLEAFAVGAAIGAVSSYFLQPRVANAPAPGEVTYSSPSDSEIAVNTAIGTYLGGLTLGTLAVENNTANLYNKQLYQTIQNSTAEKSAGDAIVTSPNTLYHYTSDEGLKGITESQKLNPSTGSVHARYGTGQYFTDIAPEAVSSGEVSKWQLSRSLFGSPVTSGNRLQSYVQVDTSGLQIQQASGRPNVFYLQGSQPLDLQGRIIKSGSTGIR